MPPFRFIDPTALGIELVYTVIMIVLCLLIYYKTKEIYQLTSHKGIKYFRNTFIFFAAAYFFRFLSLLPALLTLTLDYRFFPHLSRYPPVLIAYFSTIAILSLTLSTIWKQIKSKHLTYILHIVAIGVALIVLLFHSHNLLTVSQFALLLFALGASFAQSTRKKSKLKHVFAIYALLFVFWIINLIVGGPPQLIPVELKVIVYLISIGIFLFILHKVNHWTK